MEVFEMVMQMEKEDGRIEGRKEKETFFVENILSQTDCTDEKMLNWLA